jgi:hypothetical protein
VTAQRTNTNKPRWPPGKAKLKALIEAAIADVYDESEQRTRFSTQASHSLKQRPRGRIPRAQLVASVDLGPVGFEPTTKGFTSPGISTGSGLSLHPRTLCVWVRDTRACY